MYSVRRSSTEHAQLVAHRDDASHGAPGCTHVAVGDAAPAPLVPPGCAPGEKVRRLFDRQPESDERGDDREPRVARRPARERGPRSRAERRDAARDEKSAAADGWLE